MNYSRYGILFCTILSVMMILSSSCKKSYETVPLGQQSTLDLTFDPNDSLGKNALEFLMNVYNQCAISGHNRVSSDYLDAASDDAISSASGIPGVQAIATGAYSASATNADDVWSAYYEGIRSATVFSVYINRVPLAEKLPNGKPARPAYRSEARFLRALMYFELLKRYGGVPLLGDTIRQVTDNVQLPRNSFADCVNYIVSECNDIKDSLRIQSEINGNNYGRATQGAAMALKARVLLYAASPLFNGGNIDPANPLTGYTSYDANRWKLAADAADSVMQLGYSLVPTFSDAFITQAEPIGTNTEIIFWRQSGSNISVEQTNGPIGYTSAGGNGRTSPTQNLVDAFPTDSGKVITAADSHYDPDNPYDHRDPRLKMTVMYNGFLWLNRAVQTFDGGVDKPGGTAQQTKTSYYLRKFMGAFESVNGSAVYSNTYHDWISFRYAEVLLNFAEATNEFSGPTVDVYNVLYALRKRAGIIPGTDNSYGLTQGMSQAEMRTAIQNERRVELAFEEQRFWDIRRWKIAAQVYGSPLQGMDVQQSTSGELFYNIVSVLTPVFRDPQMYLYPIPYSEVVKNANMKQNPSW
jgi:hypothetical protein